MQKGMTVEVPADSDAAISGDRYGQVTGFKDGKVTVKMFRSRQTLTFNASDCDPV